MTEISTTSLDLAKNVFQAHGADAVGEPEFRKMLRRDQVLAFLAAQPPASLRRTLAPVRIIEAARSAGLAMR